MVQLSNIRHREGRRSGKVHVAFVFGRNSAEVPASVLDILTVGRVWCLSVRPGNCHNSSLIFVTAFQALSLQVLIRGLCPALMQTSSSTAGRTPREGDKPVARPPFARGNTKKSREQTSMCILKPVPDPTISQRIWQHRISNRGSLQPVTVQQTTLVVNLTGTQLVTPRQIAREA
jgi:hypothetical protein